MPTPVRPAEDAALALAAALGAHALELFAVLLAVVLASVTLLAWSADRMARGRAGRPRHPWVRLGLGVGLGFVLIVAAATIFAEVAEEVVEGGMPQRVDQAFMDAVQQHTAPSTRAAFGVVTRLGDPPTLTALAAIVALALWWRGQRVLAIAYAAAVGGNALLNPALKRVFERGRPLDGQGLPLADGFSFPSGHSSSSLVAYGMLAYVLLRTLPRAWHLPAVLAASATAFSVGASRVFVQAHFATDVVAGFASGSAWLVACILSAELALGWKRHAR
jgi:membrane-associated phospholipid phosphatase